MNILLTGGSGFIGKNILESFLSKKYNILAPTHSELDLLSQANVDLYFRTHIIDIVIHSAVKPGHRNAGDISNLFYIDNRMFFNILHNEHLFKKMIYLSSGSVYNMTGQSLDKVKEEFVGNLIPLDEHGFYRYTTSKYIDNVKNIIELRIFSIYGKYEDYAIRFISNLICKAIYDLPITIKQNRLFDFLFIDDLMPIIDYFVENEKLQYSAYNVSPDKSVELLAVANIVNDISGKRLPVLQKNEGLGFSYGGNNSRLRNEIHGLSLTGIERGVELLYNWYSKNMSAIDKKLLLYDK